MFDPRQIKAVVFDAYGTLFDVASIDRRLSLHFGRKAQALAALWRRKQLEYTWLRTLMNRYHDFSRVTREALLYACDQAALPADERIIADLMDHYRKLELFPEAPEALRRLKPHFQLGILSNADPELLEDAVRHNGILHLFGGIFSADAAGKFKPHPAVYALAAEGLGISAEELLFISSNPWDVAGAKSAGLPVAWIRRHNQALEHLGYTPDMQVENLLELCQVLISR